MPKGRTLVVYYSRSGRTRQAAQLLARALGADLEEIADRGGRLGVLGYARCALEGILGASTEIEPPHRLPENYELVVVGTPVWYAAASSPVRTYLWIHRGRLPRVAFFLTHGGFGGERVLGQMRSAAGCAPIAELLLRKREFQAGVHREKIAGFARALLASAGPSKAGARARTGRRRAGRRR